MQIQFPLPRVCGESKAKVDIKKTFILDDMNVSLLVVKRFDFDYVDRVFAIKLFRDIENPATREIQFNNTCESCRVLNNKII